MEHAHRIPLTAVLPRDIVISHDNPKSAYLPYCLFQNILEFLLRFKQMKALSVAFGLIFKLFM